jgi:hypothetical protein
MATTDLDGIIAKIHKLKAMAEGGATQGEIDNATALIQRLMLEHNIEEAHLAIDAGEPLTGYGYSTIHDSVSASWRGILSQGIAAGHQCRVVRDRAAGTFQVFGHRDAVPVVLALYAELSAALEAMAKRSYDDEQPYENARAWCNAYRMGAATEIYRRFERQLDEARRASERSSTALVTINDRVDQAVSKVYPKLQTVKPRQSRVSRDAYYSGAADARSMNLEHRAKLGY